MADPLGSMLSRLLAGTIGYALGQRQTRQREDIERLNNERVTRVANRVYTRTYAMLSRAKIGGKGQSLRLADILGEPALSQFTLDVAEWVRRELEQQP
jgi:hypothetical protein